MSCATPVTLLYNILLNVSLWDRCLIISSLKHQGNYANVIGWWTSTVGIITCNKYHPQLSTPHSDAFSHSEFLCCPLVSLAKLPTDIALLSWRALSCLVDYIMRLCVFCVLWSHTRGPPATLSIAVWISSQAGTHNKCARTAWGWNTPNRQWRILACVTTA